MVEVSYTLVVQLVVGEIQHLKSQEIGLAEGRHLLYRVELQVEILEVFQVSELLHAHFVVSEVESR